MLIQMVNTAEEVRNLINDLKFPPIGKRSYGVSRAQGYGFDFNEYITRWNETSTFMIQVESIEAVNNIENVVDKLGLDLHTEVINWREMRDLQLSFFRAQLPNLDIPQDHAIFASLYNYAVKNDINYILDKFALKYIK